MRVQVPVAGKALNVALPVARAQEGWVGVPGTGAVGVAGCALMTTFPEATDVQPAELVTVNV